MEPLCHSSRCQELLPTWKTLHSSHQRQLPNREINGSHRSAVQAHINPTTIGLSAYCKALKEKPNSGSSPAYGWQLISAYKCWCQLLPRAGHLHNRGPLLQCIPPIIEPTGPVIHSFPFDSHGRKSIRVCLLLFCSLPSLSTQQCGAGFPSGSGCRKRSLCLIKNGCCT